MFSVSTVLGEKASDVEQSRGAGAKLPGRGPPAHWTVTGAGKEGILFGELSVFFFCFCFLFLLLKRVHGCMGMDVRVNVFTMPFLCANSGPCRTMSRA